MNNHAHFLIYSEKSEDLSKFMQKIKTSYSFFYNSFNKRVGYVFRDRYLSQEMLSQKQLFNCLKCQKKWTREPSPCPPFQLAMLKR